jgi:hypothetical protein
VPTGARLGLRRIRGVAADQGARRAAGRPEEVGSEVADAVPQ